MPSLEVSLLLPFNFMLRAPFSLFLTHRELVGNAPNRWIRWANCCTNGRLWCFTSSSLFTLCCIKRINYRIQIHFSCKSSFWALWAFLMFWGHVHMRWLPCQLRHLMSYTEPRATTKPVQHRDSSFKLELLRASSMYHLPHTISWQSNMAGPRGRWRQSAPHISSSPLL